MTRKKRDKTDLNLIKAGVFAAIVLGLTFTSAWAQPEVTFHGQFRVNYYTESGSEKDTFGESSTAARLRFRPTWDLAFDDGVALHMQFNIGHINSGVGNHNFNQGGAAGGTPSFGLRHGYIVAPLSDSITGVAGVVPVSDKFGDTLFSSDWDFNPLAVALLGKAGELDWRFGAAKISEGNEAGTDEGLIAGDDLDVFVVDVDSGGFGGSVYYVKAGKNFGIQELALMIYGVRWAGEFGSTKVNAFVMGSSLDETDAAADMKSSGFAAKLEGKIPVGEMTLGVLGMFATGDKDFGTKDKTYSSFITPMSLIGHTGYWGYTGKLNIQGPTDTGIDNSMVNIDGGSPAGNGNLGYGITTIQANLSIPYSDKLSWYVAAGFFASTDAPSAQGTDIGTDIYAQGKYNLGSNLNLEFGADFANLGKGHFGNVVADKSRSITLLFSRLQMEW
jgi:hypothetical protein